MQSLADIWATEPGQGVLSVSSGPLVEAKVQQWEVGGEKKDGNSSSSSGKGQEKYGSFFLGVPFSLPVLLSLGT